MIKNKVLVHALWTLLAHNAKSNGHGHGAWNILLSIWVILVQMGHAAGCLERTGPLECCGKRIQEGPRTSTKA